MSQEGTPFKASSQCHPSLLAFEDAEKITIPHAVLASMDEVPEVPFPFPDWNLDALFLFQFAVLILIETDHG